MCTKQIIDGTLAWPLQEGSCERAEYDCYEMPNGHIFVHKKHCEGIIPSLSSDLVCKRRAIRATMKGTKDPVTGEVVPLDAGTYQVRELAQLTVKVAGNSLYGGTGAEKGVLPSAKYIAETVTREGREMIDLTKDVSERYGMRDGRLVALKDDPGSTPIKVIYGDTDSVFLYFHGTGTYDTQEASKQLAALMTNRFATPNDLEYEKLSPRSIFKQTKKRCGPRRPRRLRGGAGRGLSARPCAGTRK